MNDNVEHCEAERNAPSANMLDTDQAFQSLELSGVLKVPTVEVCREYVSVKTDHENGSVKHIMDTEIVSNQNGSILEGEEVNKNGQINKSQVISTNGEIQDHVETANGFKEIGKLNVQKQTGVEEVCVESEVEKKLDCDAVRDEDDANIDSSECEGDMKGGTDDVKNVGRVSEDQKELEKCEHVESESHRTLNDCALGENSSEKSKFNFGISGCMEDCDKSDIENEILTTESNSEPMIKNVIKTEVEDGNESDNGYGDHKSDLGLAVPLFSESDGSIDCDNNTRVKFENLELNLGENLNYSRPWLNGNFASGNSGENGLNNNWLNLKKSKDTCDFKKVKQKSFNPELEKAVNHSKESLMKFAEILYKCTLCTSIPSILTSKESFMDHVNEHHLTKGNHFHTCSLCSLKFRTEEDLKEHVMCLHTGSDIINGTCDRTGNDIIGSNYQENCSNNDSDSDSSGHRQFRAKVVKKTKPVHDFESPKQLVDHTGIETWNGSLDLSKKQSEELEKTERKKGTKQMPKKEITDINIQQITDQIIKSDVQCRNQSESSGNKLPFIPSSTPEFGKYTKLVREGGNIVYFCQICNWKSPIKTTFQVHCNMTSHKNKIQNVGNPESAEKSTNDTKSSKSCDKHDKSDTSGNACRNVQDSASSRGSPWSPQDVTYGPKFPSHSLFYNYIVQSRGTTPGGGRTPVVAPYGSQSAGIFENSTRFTYKRSNDNPVDLAMKKRKRTSRNGPMGRRMFESESEEEPVGLGSKESYKTSPSMALLRNKLLESACRTDSACRTESACRTDFEGMKFNSNTSGSMKYSKHETIFSAMEQDRSETHGSINLSTLKSEPIENGHNCDNSISSPVNRLRSDYGESKTTNPYDSDMLKLVRTEQGPKLNKCHACMFEYSKIEEYERHFDKVHKSMLGNMLQARSPDVRFPRSAMWPSGGAGDQGWVEAGSRLWDEKLLSSGQEGRLEVKGGKSVESVEGGNCEMGENWRVQKLKELLSDYVIECEKGNTSRDNLLQCISIQTEFTDAMLWSSACNRAVRELFPNSQAQRKGKYKKTFYFGISMLDSYQVSEESAPFDGEPSQAQLPPRDISMDMERIVEQLPSILKWTGCMDTGVHRQELLAMLAATLHDPDAINWGAQCNRAIRLIFPLVDMKRKGKYKAMYLGVEFHKSAQRILSHHNGLQLFKAQHSIYSSNSPPMPSLMESYQHPEESKRETTLMNMLSKGRNSPTSAMNRGNNSPTNLSVKGHNSLNVRQETSAHNTGIQNKEKIDSKNELDSSFSESIRRDAQNEMEEYLLKFGGVPSIESVSGSPRERTGEDNENDGDDEEESLDSGM